MSKKFKKKAKKEKSKKKKHQAIPMQNPDKNMFNIGQPEPGHLIRAISRGSKFTLSIWRTKNENYIVGIKYNPIKRLKNGNIKVRSKPIDERLRTSDKKEAEDKFLELQKELFG